MTAVIPTTPPVLAAPPEANGRRPLLVGLAIAAVSALAGFLLASFVAPDAANVPAASSVDVGFLRDMADHHDQAVRLAVVELERGESQALQGMALDTIALQRHEIGLMEARLVDWGHGRGDLPRTAMAWMGMATPVARMPGMATEQDVARLVAAAGVDADRLFVELMTAHHAGGIHMAEYAAEHARTPAVRELAERIAKTQRIELVDLSRAAAKQGD